MSKENDSPIKINVRKLPDTDIAQTFDIGDYFIGEWNVGFGGSSKLLRRVVSVGVDYYGVYTPKHDYVRGKFDTVEDAVNQYTNIVPVRVISHEITVEEVN